MFSRRWFSWGISLFLLHRVVASGRPSGEQPITQFSTPPTDHNDLAYDSLATPDTRPQEAIFYGPHVTPKQVALALRFSCEMNRQLRLGCLQSEPTSLHMQPLEHQIPLGPPRQSLVYEEPNMIFCAPTPVSDGRGAARWGPDLQSYVRQVLSILDSKEPTSSLEIALALIYLDRACSVETPRTNGELPCPFCSPRTVHRLFVAAMLHATQVVRGQPAYQYFPKLEEELGVPAQQLNQLMISFEMALGDLGFFVSTQQMEQWKQTWYRVFRDNHPSPNPNPLVGLQNSQQALTARKSTTDANAVHTPSPGFFPESTGPQPESSQQSLTPRGFSSLPAFHNKVAA